MWGSVPLGGKQRVIRLNLPLRRPAIDRLTPCVDDGRFPIKRTVGEVVQVTAELHADGHDLLSAAILYRSLGERSWRESPLTHQGNDVWTGTFCIESLREHHYTVQAWVNAYLTWQTDLIKRF